MKKRSASTVVYLIFFFVVFLAFSAFAVDATIIFAQRAKLQNATEATALAAASEFSSTSTNAAIIAAADSAFQMWKYGNLENATITTGVNSATREVLITTQALAQPFFLAFLGVSGIELNAVSRAEGESLPITANYSGINWITAAASYRTDIISRGTNLNDTAIIQPLGGLGLASIDAVMGLPKFNLIDTLDGQPLSLGPGGFITIKLPAPIVNRPGSDLLINEIGIGLEGYMVFVGLDANPQNPYMHYQSTGDDLRWVNISCTGTPTSEGSGFGPYTVPTSGLGAQDKYYGSASFDIGGSCIGSEISMAKYLRIVDDNDESAFVNGAPVMLFGEASTPTAGADIDAVSVLNHARLIPPSQMPKFVPN